MNALLQTLGIEAWKPVLTALVLPPVPLLLLVLVGARLMFRRPLLAWLLVLLATLGLWFSGTQALGQVLVQWLDKPPPALSSREVAELRRSPKTALIVLGGGRRTHAPEYGVSTLNFRGAERLRYGIWLARETGLPLGFSGGTGYGPATGPSEAEIAARMAEREFGRALRWQETESRDTRENALKTVALLQPQGIEKIVLVTDALHMRRALANFQRATEGTRITVVAAPMGVRGEGPLSGSAWLPSLQGFDLVWMALHESLGRLVGA
jgi:uncharacterized SAM-binding protein YcdF (DUF218 family)